MVTATPKRGEFWLVDLNPVRGHEQGERRPCLIVSANGLNESPLGLAMIIPLTKTGRGFPSHVKIAANQSGLNFDSFAMCEQIRSVSAERLEKPIGNRAPGAVMVAVENALKILLSLK
jgi:mRNA interferase MazF